MRIRVKGNQALKILLLLLLLLLLLFLFYRVDKKVTPSAPRIPIAAHNLKSIQPCIAWAPRP